MAKRIRSFDWATTSLGPISGWPDSLKQMVNVLLHSPLGMVLLWGGEGVMIYNDAFIPVAGDRHPDMLGSEVLTQWPEVAEFNQNVLEVCLNGGSLSYKDQPLIFHRNGQAEDVWIDSDYSPVVGLTGQIEGVFAVVSETTERKLFEKAQDEATQQVNYILESTMDSVFMLNKDWQIVIVNSMHEKVTNTKREEILGKPFWDVFPAGPESKYWIEHHKVMQTREPSHFDEYYEPLDLWTGTDVYPTLDGGIAVFFRDISDRKKSEAKERELLSITAQRDALVKVNKTKDEFIGMASHQLRTPATAVKQYLGMVLEDFAGPLLPEQRHFISTAYESNERELGLINDLLKTAQMASDEYSLNKQQQDISKLLQDCVDDLKPTLEMHKQKIVLTLPKQPIKSMVDVTEMKLAIVNLLENASKYSHDSSQIRVALSQKDNYFHIRVRDKGVGISQENQQRIFDKFTRVDNELSDTVSGTGLGLFWVKQIVDVHGGTIALTSEMNKGSTFEIKMPLSV